MYLSDMVVATQESVETTAESVLSFGERVSTGLGTSLLGMLTIFFMLTVLFIMMKLMSAVFGKSGKKAEKSVPVTLPAKDPVPVAVQAEAEDEEETPSRAISGLNGWIDCFDRAEFAGSVFVGGVTDPEEISGNEKLGKAYEAGFKAGLLH